MEINNNRTKKSVLVQLGIMMFMQYLLLAVWWVQFAAYLENLVHLESYQATLILCSMAIGSMAAPLVGVIADRYMNSEKLLAILNLLVAVFLFLAAQQTQFVGIIITVTLAMLCYMPSWSLTSSIAMTHVSSEQFPRIRIIGSIGWVASGVFSLTAIHVFKVPIFDGTVYPLYCAAGIALLTALFNLSLPKTPPTADKAAKYSISDIFGLKVISTLKNKNFNRFIIITFLSTLPFVLYHVYGSMFFSYVNVKNITVTMNWGQLAEMFFLFVTTSILVKYGIKNAFIFGLSAMLLRYLSFYVGIEFGMQWLYSIGILAHGLIFGLFYVAGQVYTDKIVPPKLRAQAQGLLAFVTWGVGFLVGTLLNGWMIGNYKVNNHTDWSLLFLIATIASVLLVLLMFTFFKNPSLEKRDN